MNMLHVNLHFLMGIIFGNLSLVLYPWIQVMKVQRYLQKERSLSTQMGFPNPEKIKELQALLQVSFAHKETKWWLAPFRLTLARQCTVTAEGSDTGIGVCALVPPFSACETLGNLFIPSKPTSSV